MTNSSDYHSPQQRLRRYREELGRRIVQRMFYVATFGALWMYTISLAMIDKTPRALFASFLVVPVLMVAGDFYSFVRDFVEQRLFCPPYDKASSPRPKFVVPETLQVLQLRLVIYMLVTPLLPMMVVYFLTGYAQVVWLRIAIDWSVSLLLALAFGTLRMFGWPVTVRSWIQPFKRVPSPDIN